MVVEKVEVLRAEFDRAGFAERRKPEISERGEIGVEVIVGAQRIASDRTELSAGGATNAAGLKAKPAGTFLWGR